MGRRAPPVEQHRGGLEDETVFNSRIAIAQIQHVDTLNGRVVIEYNGRSQQDTLQIPLNGFGIKGLKSSWQRYMPQGGEFVKVMFEADNTPHIIGYAAYGEELQDGKRTGNYHAPRNGGYGTVARIAKSNRGLGLIFRELRPGEWDMRSSGGADIYGAADGTLSLAAGGGAQIILRKDAQEERHRNLLSAWDLDGVTLKLGRTRRRLPGETNETDVAPNPASAPLAQEFSLRLAYKTPPQGTPEIEIYKTEVGDVRSSLGLPETVSGIPIRQRTVWSDPTGVTSLSLTVDALGNANIDQGPLALATGIKINGGGVSGARTTNLATDFALTTINSTITSTLSASVNTVLDGPVISLGGPGAVVEPVIRGLSNALASTTWAGAQSTDRGLLAAFVGAIVLAVPVFNKIPNLKPDETALLTAIGKTGEAVAKNTLVYAAALATYGTGLTAALSVGGGGGVFVRLPMAVDLSPCAQLLCGLSAPVRGVIKAALGAQKTLLQAELAPLQAQLLALDVATAPLAFAQSIAESALATARSALSILPTDIVVGCASLGQINVDLVTATDALTADVRAVLDDLNRLLSFQEEIRAVILEFEAIIDRFTALVDLIEVCGQ
jgi:hypothetical protein